MQVTSEEGDTDTSADMSRIVKSSYLGKDPFGDINSVEDVAALEPEQLSLLRSLQEHNHIHVRVHCERILSKELEANGELGLRRQQPKKIPHDRPRPE